MSLNFVALDVETANTRRGSICAIGLAVVEDGRVVRTENWLAKPVDGLDDFHSFNVHLHGITPAMVKDQPPVEQRLADAMDIIGDRAIVAHNAAFDVGAVREVSDALGSPWPQLTYGCSLVMSRSAIPLVSYRLPIVCSELGIVFGHHHEAGADAEGSAHIVLELARRQEAESLEHLADLLRVRLGQVSPSEWFGCIKTKKSPSRAHNGSSSKPEVPETNWNADPEGPFYGEVIACTGGLQTMTRSVAWELLAERGAIVQTGVNKHTTKLLVGGGFRGETLEDFHTGKALKALKWREKGHDIEVIDESELLQMI